MIIVKKAYKPVLTFKEMLDYYRKSVGGGSPHFLKNTSKASYFSSLNSIDKANGGATASWISTAIQSKSSNPVEDAINTFDSFFSGYSKVTPKTISNWKSSYRGLAETIIGIFYGNVSAFANNRSSYDILLCQIVAQNALFACKDVVDDVISGKAGTKDNISDDNPYASWDHMIHVRATDVKKGSAIIKNGFNCVADDNTSANHYIKQAIIRSLGLKNCTHSLFHDYEACHVWGMADDPRYYASIANLVLVPRAFGQLTDHCPAVKQLLRYEVYRRFGFVPDGVPVPAMPVFYSKIVWR